MLVPAADVCELRPGGDERVYGLPQGQLLLHILSEEGQTPHRSSAFLEPRLNHNSLLTLLATGGAIACGELSQRPSLYTVYGTESQNIIIYFILLQDWKDHQHTCCQSAGGVTIQEEEPITTISMDKVK